MKAVYCPYCGGRTKRNGRTSSGSQRWRCTACGASTTVRYDDTATRLEEFLGWLLSKDSQATMPGGGRSFRRRTAEFWEVWPMPVPDGELHRVLYGDGIWVARDRVVLICCSGERVVSWYMARSENSRAWSARMAPIPAPDVVVTDGIRALYLSTETSPLRRNLYSVRLDGKDKRRLTQGEGYYSIAPSRGMKYCISTFSNASTPNRVEVCDAEGNTVRTLCDSRRLREELAASGRPGKEFFTFTTERGDTLNAYIVKPRGFDASQRYPVLLTQYSGPGSQSVSDRWSLDWEDALTDKGYIVVCADGRGTGFRGEKFKKSTYGRLGAQEVEDQLSFARYMASQPYVDPARIGSYGWSYGGFMALGCAMKGHGLFRMAIAVAPVTSRLYYDSFSTEIYNYLPQNNAAGYDDNSPINFARMLDDTKTRLLLIHGTADDNVHFQNTVEMARALNRAGKQYDMMVYPDQNHSMMPDDTRNVRQKMIDYTLEHL